MVRTLFDDVAAAAAAEPPDVRASGSVCVGGQPVVRSARDTRRVPPSTQRQDPQEMVRGRFLAFWGGKGYFTHSFVVVVVVCCFVSSKLFIIIIRDLRERFFGKMEMKDIFTDIPTANLFGFLKETDLFFYKI